MMKRFLAALQHQTQQKHWAHWVNLRTILLAAVLLVFLTGMSICEPIPETVYAKNLLQIKIQQNTPVPAQTSIPEDTIPPELVTNYEQTNGILIGGVVLVLIIISSTVSFITREPIPKSPPK